MTVLIIGGHGFIGSRLRNFLSLHNQPFKFTSSKRKDSRLNNFFQLDLANLEGLDKNSLKNIFCGVDTTVFLPSLNAKESSNKKHLAKTIKVQGAKFCLEKSIYFGVKRFINISSCHVYGANLAGEYDEYSDTNPSSNYAENHAVAENELIELSKGESIKCNSLRLSNGVGCPIDSNTDCWMLLINDLCKQLVTTGKMELYSPPNIARDFIPISLIESIIFSLACGKVNLEEKVLNLTSANAIEIHRIASMIKINSKKILGKHAKVYFRSAPDASPRRFKLSNNLLNKNFENLDFSLENEVNLLLKKSNAWFS
tara:strand:- start:7098 stop:8036 length:939 start_codon:yes stop_codon:yes gene_type:complete